ncbi:SHIRT domain-containing protein [Listeria innocua]|uniref:SHIRT domain-containing protein n=1 Tax=Listeria innocua TaxID=1642 RepID=UPI0021AB7676|nr:SHIRT domain-containing protein [Listeria innocua]
MNGFFSGCSKLESITLGENSIFYSIVKLPAINTTDGNYSGEWIGVDTENIYTSSDDFMDNYDGNISDTYVWRGTPIEDPIDQSTLEVQDSTLYVGDTWNPQDNFVSASDYWGNEVLFDQISYEGHVDTTQPGTYTVQYRCMVPNRAVGTYSATATITILEREAQIVPARIEYLDENKEPLRASKDCSSVIGSFFSFESPIEIDGYTVDLDSTTFIITHDDGSVTHTSYDDILSLTNTLPWVEALDVFNSKIIVRPTKSVVLTYQYSEVLSEPTPTYNAGYTFVSGTTGKSLPSAVMALLPSDPENYENDDLVTAIAPVQMTVTASSGAWTFQGWDADSKTVSGDDVIFTGTWTFEANEPDNPNTPNKPDTPNNSDTPSNSDTPRNPDKPSTPDKSNHPDNQNTSDSQQKTGKITTELPKTGDTQLSGLWGIAFLLSGITLLILKIRKRKVG